MLSGQAEGWRLGWGVLASREGPALLQGLVICGKCGGRMTVRYHSRKGNQVPEYVCQSEGIQHGKTICQRIPGAGIDAAVSRFLLDTVTPLALETALAVADELTTRADEADRIRATAVQRAQYHADLGPAAATSPSTPPTGSSPTNSKPPGTQPCASSVRPPTPTNGPATSKPGH